MDVACVLGENEITYLRQCHSNYGNAFINVNTMNDKFE